MLETAASEETAPSSGSPGPGSTGAYVNERGQVCFGNECFSIAVDTDRKQIEVEIREELCSDELKGILQDMTTLLGKGARTVYTVEHEVKD